MKIKTFLTRFGLVFAVTFAANALAVYLWNVIAHGQGAFEWETSFRFAVILGIVLPLARVIK